MDSSKNASWVTPALVVLIGGLMLYSMSRGPCPANSGGTRSPVSATSPEEVAEGRVRLAHADISTFDEVVLQSDEPVLVDFYADWCGPCQVLAPKLERAAESLTAGRIVKINVDNDPELAARYQVQSIPTLLLFVDGEVAERRVGVASEREIVDLLQVK